MGLHREDHGGLYTNRFAEKYALQYLYHNCVLFIFSLEFGLGDYMYSLMLSDDHLGVRADL